MQNPQSKKILGFLAGGIVAGALLLVLGAAGPGFDWPNGLLTLVQRDNSPSNPASGNVSLYLKNGRVHTLTSAGVETELAALSDIIVGTGDMAKATYDTDNNGRVDRADATPWSSITETPTTVGGYGITAIPWHLITETPTSCVGYGITALPWHLITETPTSFAGYGIAAPQILGGTTPKTNFALTIQANAAGESTIACVNVAGPADRRMQNGLGTPCTLNQLVSTDTFYGPGPSGNGFRYAHNDVTVSDATYPTGCQSFYVRSWFFDLEYLRLDGNFGYAQVVAPGGLLVGDPKADYDGLLYLYANGHTCSLAANESQTADSGYILPPAPPGSTGFWKCNPAGYMSFDLNNYLPTTGGTVSGLTSFETQVSIGTTIKQTNEPLTVRGWVANTGQYLYNVVGAVKRTFKRATTAALADGDILDYESVLDKDGTERFMRTVEIDDPTGDNNSIVRYYAMDGDTLHEYMRLDGSQSRTVFAQGLHVGDPVAKTQAPLILQTGDISGAKTFVYTGSGQSSDMVVYLPSAYPASTAFLKFDTAGNMSTDTTLYQIADADLTRWARISPSLNGESIVAAADYATMRTLLGLGNAATKDTGTGSTNVATGDHAHSGVYEPIPATATSGNLVSFDVSKYVVDSGAKASDFATATHKHTEYLRGVITTPGTYYSGVDHEVAAWIKTDAAITITSVKLVSDADPTTETQVDLYWADSLIGYANATKVVTANTASGETTITSGFADATVASGKALYWIFQAAPDAALKWIGFEVQYTHD
ncbi:MAG: hypothetical protein LLG20_01870 [Acidobacteriales bacterium]|nr:hypothetical protein [Terriglobales bacterium]